TCEAIINVVIINLFQGDTYTIYSFSRLISVKQSTYDSLVMHVCVSPSRWRPTLGPMPPSKIPRPACAMPCIIDAPLRQETVSFMSSNNVSSCEVGIMCKLRCLYSGKNLSPNDINHRLMERSI